MRCARRRITVAVVSVALTLSGCADINPFNGAVTTPQTRGLPDDANAADAAFLRDMIDQLQDGQALTAAALDPGVNVGEDTHRMAGHIEQEDDARIDKMTKLLDDWGQPGAEAATSKGVVELAGLTGEAFDERWTALMIEHHDRAAVLAEDIKRDGSNRMVSNLATGMLVDLGSESIQLASR